MRKEGEQVTFFFCFCLDSPPFKGKVNIISNIKNRKLNNNPAHPSNSNPLKAKNGFCAFRGLLPIIIAARYQFSYILSMISL